MSRNRIDDSEPAQPYDCALRWLIPSDSDPHASYVVELDSYGGNGECSCPWFDCKLRPLLARGITPAQAVEQGLIKLKPKQRVEQSLQCKHISDAQTRLAVATVKAFSHAKNHPTSRPD